MWNQGDCRLQVRDDKRPGILYVIYRAKDGHSLTTKINLLTMILSNPFQELLFHNFPYHFNLLSIPPL